MSYDLKDVAMVRDLRMTLQRIAGVINELDGGGVFAGASATVAGTAGNVPAPAAGDNEKFLRGDGTWATFTAGAAEETEPYSQFEIEESVSTLFNGTAYGVDEQISRILQNELFTEE